MTNARDKAAAKWGTTPGSGREYEYSPHNFYINSTNEHDHSSSIRLTSKPIAEETEQPETITLPPEIYAQILSSVESDQTPYRTKHDFWRDAAVHRLHQLDEMKELGFEPFLMQYRMLHEMVAIDREDEGMERLIKAYQERVDRYLTDDNAHGVGDIIERARRYTHKVPLRLRKKWIEAIAGWEKTRDRI